jgi:hypothetical protein
MHTETPPLLIASLAATLVALGIGAVDGLYFHLRRFRLYEHAESRFEHAIHTGRAWLAVPALALLYLVDSGGPALYAALGVVLADQVLAGLDLWVERKSRARWGGVPHGEYVVHVVAHAFHGIGIALAFASRPGWAWSWSASSQASSLPELARWLVVVLAGGAAIAAVQHVFLLFGRGAGAGESLGRR